ncbi:hypothetical protein BWI97_20610 [Siphonobacter sp. BAB-5405]|uniref:ATP-binding protein n=1 Tax=Siphonobacter sp. BAB-5405 TaxID=1864825 RepID=UPI000C7F885F|nr:ATP-binding protein [Siphonobacter sp. BAB-5405]PMD92491.1 hypothetical protein BWI97_20610 [Siphonobacter sp. BAB-5405]
MHNTPFSFLGRGGEVGQWIRAYDWSKTLLGNPESWPLTLKSILGLLLNAECPSFLFWGKEYTCFYNDAYLPILKKWGKSVMPGQAAAQVWPESWTEFKSFMEEILTKGKAQCDDDLAIGRQVWGIETNGTFCYNPVQDEVGQTVGVWVTLTYPTQQLQESETRQRFLLRLSDRLRSLTDPAEIQYEAARVLGEQLEADRVGYAEDQGDHTHIIVTRNYVNGVSNLEGLYQYVDYGPSLLADFLAGRTVVRPDIPNDPTLTDVEKEAHRVLQLGATVNRPLMKQGQLIAVLFIHYEQPHAFTQLELDLLEETAERTWEAVDRARAQKALLQSEERFRHFADTIPQAIWETNAEGDSTFLNQWWIQYSGVPYEATTAWQIATDILHPEDGPVLVAAFREAMRTGQGFEVEQRNRSASGEYCWFLNKGAPFRHPETGQIIKWIGIGVDIHDRKLAEQLLRESEARYRQLAAHLEEEVQKRTEELTITNQELASTVQQLRTANEELEESNRLLLRSNENLQQFAYVASHDLQEPLRKIQSFGNLLIRQHAPQLGNGVDYVERMQAAASRMSVLIEDLLAFSLISTQREASDPIDLNAVVQTVRRDLELTITETEAVVDVDDLPTIAGNRFQLEQLFQNLLSNALKFRKPGVAPHIHIRVQQITSRELPTGVRPLGTSEAYCRISVSDNGIGFDDRYLDRVFQVFQRLHKRSDYEGTGIGLAICEKVVANHGGVITAHSQPDQGSTFEIYLPI